MEEEDSRSGERQVDKNHVGERKCFFVSAIKEEEWRKEWTIHMGLQCNDVMSLPFVCIRTQKKISAFFPSFLLLLVIVWSTISTQCEFLNGEEIFFFLSFSRVQQNEIKNWSETSEGRNAEERKDFFSLYHACMGSKLDFVASQKHESREYPILEWRFFKEKWDVESWKFIYCRERAWFSLFEIFLDFKSK